MGMSTTKAVKEFFNPPVVTMDELKAFRASMSQEEWNDTGKAICKEMGQEWEAPPAPKSIVG